MTSWFRLTLICCVLLCLLLGLTQAVACNYQPVVSTGPIFDRATNASDSPTRVVGSRAPDLSRAGPFRCLVLDCGLTAGDIGPPGQESPGEPRATGTDKPWQVAGPADNSNQRHPATSSEKLLVFSRKFEESGFCISL